MNIYKSCGMDKDTFLSLSEETKLKMTMNRFRFYADADEVAVIYTWLIDNIKHPFFVNEICVLFYDETDAVAFKLRWVE